MEVASRLHVHLGNKKNVRHFIVSFFKGQMPSTISSELKPRTSSTLGRA